VRLTPLATFLGTVLLGLPFAVTVGRTLAAPADHPAPVSSPAGGGTLGTPPQPVAEPVAPFDWSTPLRAPTRPHTPESTPSSQTPAPAPSTGRRSASPSPSGPPVPTPTTIPRTPAGPSAPPSAVPSQGLSHTP
jgi:hypothetical protein